MADAAATATVTDESDAIGGVARDHLKAFVSRIERLEEDKKAVMDDMKEVYAEAKSMGFDTKILRQVIRLRKIDRNERQEAEALEQPLRHHPDDRHHQRPAPR